MTDEDRIKVAVVELRLLGVHPSWIDEWVDATKQGMTFYDKPFILGALKWMEEHGSQSVASRYSQPMESDDD